MNKKSNEKILIAGAGRSGTTFLVQILTRLGYDTGFTPYEDDEPETEARAGLENNINIKGTSKEVRKFFDKKIPYIIKAPYMSINLKLLYDVKAIGIEHVIIPIRDLNEVARSRIETGLLWNIKDDELNQQMYSAYVLGSVVETCVTRNIPYTIMKFPDLVADKDYCYKQLKSIFKDLDKKKFNKVFKEIANVSKIKTTSSKPVFDKNSIISIVSFT